MSDLLERLTAALSGQYEIVRELGEGGMAYVFMARDEKHDRQVAIKILKPELASSLGSDRFLREIQVAAKLSHPHILPMFDSGVADDFLYYVMPFVEGESLGDLLEREPQLAIFDAMDICREVADALAYAHSRGVVHRDIKPDNIMLSGGHAIVADFGIARALDAAGGDKLTQTGMAVGTPQYMSPEQVGGGDDVDGRTDIYSLGCVLYEMLVGQVPFTGPTPMAVMARHTMDPPTPPSIMRDSISPELEDVILCAMAKTPADRFRTAGEFSDALKVIATGTGTLPRASRAIAAQQRLSRATLAQRPSTFVTQIPGSGPRVGRRTIGVASVAALAIAAGVWQFVIRDVGASSVDLGPAANRVAVTYFDDLSADGELGYLADGLTEGLIASLAGVRALDVISRNGVAQFRGSGVTADSVARALGVGSVIEGSVERSSGGVRVSTRLVDASGSDINRTTFTLPLADVLALQDSVVQRVAQLLRSWIGDEVDVRSARASTSSPDAWALQQRGERERKSAEAFLAERDLDEAVRALERADSLLAQAEAADDRWVTPPVDRGWVALRRGQVENALDADPQPWYERGLEHAARASAIDPSDATMLELRGTLRNRLWRLDVISDPDEQARLLDSAQADLERAVDFDATRADAYYELSLLFYDRKDNLSALLNARNAYEADAYLRNSANNFNRLFWTHYDVARFTEARRWCDEGARRFPRDWRFVDCQAFLQLAPRADRRIDRAWDLAFALDTLGGAIAGHVARVVAAGVIGLEGMRDSMEAVLAATIESARAHSDIGRADVVELRGYEAMVRTMMGQQDQAIDLLVPYVAMFPDHSFQVDNDFHWWWRPLSTNPRFSRVTER